MTVSPAANLRRPVERRDEERRDAVGRQLQVRTVL